MGINDWDYMRRRPEKESKLAQAKSAVWSFIETNPKVAGILLAAVIIILLLLWKS